MKKVVFPTLAKAMVYLYSIASILKELMSIIIFFTPCLGLFHLLNHLKFEKIPFKGSLKKSLEFSKPRGGANPNFFFDFLMFSIKALGENWKWSDSSINAKKKNHFLVYTVSYRTKLYRTP